MTRHCASPDVTGKEERNQMKEKMPNELQRIRYNCPKCGSRKYNLSEIRVAHNLFTQLFDLQATKYTAVACDKCMYTEFYKIPVSKINGVFDFFAGG